MQAIVQACVDCGATTVRLEVPHINEQAVCFYARQGFEHTNTHAETSIMIKRLAASHSAEHG